MKVEITAYYQNPILQEFVVRSYVFTKKMQHFLFWIIRSIIQNLKMLRFW